jgi:hypothetical protein
VATRRFVLAVRRDMRSHEPPDWQQQLSSCPGAHVIGLSGGRAVADLDAAALATLQQQLGRWLHIEPVVEHAARPPDPPDEA